ncbi:MAG: 8-oxo-dGTP diphosphatase [Cognaticolwellia sp.]|jgi:8-oxo-dGTP diphosphatase
MEYRNPTPTVDLIIAQGPGVVLIRRRNPPLGWALPGGFVDEGETVEAAATREALEETGLKVTLQELLYVYSDPKRDSRQHNLSVVFTATATGTPQGADDADEAKVFALNALPDLLFDHARILADYQHYLDTGERPNPQVGR